MIASGWQTAPPQLTEVVLATKSAALQLLEAPYRGTEFQSFVPSHSQSGFGTQLIKHRVAAARFGNVPVASASPFLSELSVSSSTTQLTDTIPPICVDTIQ